MSVRKATNSADVWHSATRVGHGVACALLEPAPTQHLVQRDKVRDTRESRSDQILLSAVERTLRIQHRQVALDAARKARTRQAVGLGRRVHERLLRLQLIG